MLHKKRAAYRAMGSLFFFLFLIGCAATPQSDRIIANIPEQLIKPVELKQVPFYAQQKYQCGPAALAALLKHHDKVIDLDALSKRVYIPARKGSLQVELITAAREYELIPYIIEPELQTLLKEVKAGNPVLVLQNLGVSWYPQWHYAVVVGFDLQERNVILRSGTIQRYAMNLYTFEHTWRRSKRWGMLLLKPGALPAVNVSDSAWRYLQAIVGFEQKQNWDLLDTAYQAGLENWPGQTDLIMGYGNNLYQQGNKLMALEQYEKVIANNKAFAPAHNNAAQVYAELGQFKKAIAYANKAIELGGVHIQQFKSTLKDILKMQIQNK